MAENDHDRSSLMTDEENETEKQDETQNLVNSINEDLEDKECLSSFIPKRYLVTILAMFGFFNAYAQRVNLSVALVAMVNNVTHFGHAVKTKVCYSTCIYIYVYIYIYIYMYTLFNYVPYPSAL